MNDTEILAQSVLTSTELNLIDALGSAFVDFCQLPMQHPSDKEEMQRAIHAAQLIIMARAARRLHPVHLRNHDRPKSPWLTEEDHVLNWQPRMYELAE